MASRATVSTGFRLLLSSIRSSTGRHFHPCCYDLQGRGTRRRTITSYASHLGVQKLQPVVEMVHPEEKISHAMFYEEALERWQTEAQRMREAMLLNPQDYKVMAQVSGLSREQVNYLLEIIETDEEISHIRRGWVVANNY